MGLFLEFCSWTLGINELFGFCEWEILVITDSQTKLLDFKRFNTNVGILYSGECYRFQSELSFIWLFLEDFSHVVFTSAIQVFDYENLFLGFLAKYDSLIFPKNLNLLLIVKDKFLEFFTHKYLTDSFANFVLNVMFDKVFKM